MRYNARDKAIEKKSAVVEKTASQIDSLTILRDKKTQSAKDYLNNNHDQAKNLINTITDEKPIIIVDTTYAAKRQYIAKQVARFELSGDSR
jgi:hypothetical protein